MQYRIADMEEWQATRAKVAPERREMFDRGEVLVTEKGVRVLPPGSSLPEVVTRDLPPAAPRASAEPVPVQAPEPQAAPTTAKNAAQLWEGLDGEPAAEEAVDVTDFWGTKERNADLAKTRAVAKADATSKQDVDERLAADFITGWNDL